MLPKGRRSLAGVTMGFCWHQWVRLAVAGLLALSGVAVLVGRSSPPRPSRRVPGQSSYVCVNTYQLGVKYGAIRSWPR